MSPVEVLKFGSSVLRTQDDLPVAVDEIYRHWRSGCCVLAVVSAFEGVTDRLFKEAESLFGVDSGDATAAFVAAGEERTAALLVEALVRCGMRARISRATGDPLAGAGHEPREYAEWRRCGGPRAILAGLADSSPPRILRNRCARPTGALRSRRLGHVRTLSGSRTGRPLPFAQGRQWSFRCGSGQQHLRTPIHGALAIRN